MLVSDYLLYFSPALRIQPKVLAHCLNEALGPFRDERDSGELIFTPIALLVGLSLPLWWLLSQPPKDTTVELGKWCYNHVLEKCALATSLRN